MNDPHPDNKVDPTEPGDHESGAREASLRLSELLARPLGGVSNPAASQLERPLPPITPIPATRPPDKPAKPEPIELRAAKSDDQRNPAHSNLQSPAVQIPASPVPALVPNSSDDAPPASLRPEPAKPPAVAPAIVVPVTAPAEPPSMVAPVEKPVITDSAAPPTKVSMAAAVEKLDKTASAAVPQEINPATARTLAKVRRLMLISNLFVLLAVVGVLGVIGYRVFRGEGSVVPAPLPPAPPVATAPPIDMALSLPRGARILQTAVAEGRIVVTLEVEGATEIRTFDVQTLQPVGRMTFGSVP